MKTGIRKRKSLAAVSAALFGLMLLTTACTASVNRHESDLKMASLTDMPAEVQSSAETVRQAYQFAVANPEIIESIPCYCGCGPMGHTSNYSCYVQSGEGADVVFDTHALGCGICVDITQDVMQMTREGKSLAAIRSTIDENYSRFGPSNMP